MQNVMQQVPVFDSVLHTLAETVAGRSYTVSVWLPMSYAETTDSFPVVYVLDGNVLFPMAASTALPISMVQEIPEVIVVGIGVPMRTYDDWGTHRDRDFTPSVDSANPGTGEAAIFLQMLQTDVIPFVDGLYRTKPQDRTIFGYSLGGLFVVYAYLQAPALFQGYVAGSPALDWDNQALHAQIDTVSAADLTAPRRLVLSAGEYEADYRATVDAFSKRLQQRLGQSSNLITQVFDGETHGSGIARAYVHGLKAVFGK